MKVDGPTKDYRIVTRYRRDPDDHGDHDVHP